VDAMIDIARALDANNFPAARAGLCDPPRSGVDATGRKLLLSLWRRYFKLAPEIVNAPAKGDRSVASIATDLGRRAEKALDGQEPWRLYHFLPMAEKHLGSDLLAAFLAGVFWDRVADLPDGMAREILARVFLGQDGGLFADLFEQSLANRDHVPDFWLVQSLLRTFSELGESDHDSRLSAIVRRAKRPDLVHLFEVYLGIAHQDAFELVADKARHLTAPAHRARVSSMLLGLAQTERTIAAAVALHYELGAPPDPEEAAFMEARQALSERRWHDVTELTSGIVNHPQLGKEAICLRALALAHLGDLDNARAAIRYVAEHPASVWFLRFRASVLSVAQRLLADGAPPPGEMAAPALAVRAGRPMAQSLWVGPRLRWIERLSMATYLANGWRYRLFVYETPENVPEGVELADATSVIDRRQVFREDAGSGMHKGSLGAFSDLFRYLMIARFGGMWTDTDVINLRAFDPEGARFLATERTDAGLIGLNGAMMAAPAGDPLQKEAASASLERLQAGDFHFGRIGPELLCDMIGNGGAQGYRILPVAFLNPVGWMETGLLTRPSSVLRSRGILETAMNIHVYTETWRLLGMNLAEPPESGFLSVLYAQIAEAPANHRRPVLDVLGV
jgi:hypothetical protein